MHALSNSLRRTFISRPARHQTSASTNIGDSLRGGCTAPNYHADIDDSLDVGIRLLALNKVQASHVDSRSDIRSRASDLWIVYSNLWECS